MHPKNNASLVLETLPNGESAWLRPASPSPVDRYRLTDRVVIADQVEDIRYVLTTRGRAAIHGASC